MTMNRVGYWRRLLGALAGRDVTSGEGLPLDEGAADLRARVASLEMDLAERDRQIAEMRSEYGTLELAKERAAAGAGQEELEKLFKRLSGTLANLAALRAMAESGQEVEAGDLLSLVRSLEKELIRAGLEPIGQVGQATEFDVASHQRMSGGAVRAGTPVTVQLPGYRLGQRVLMKALVSAAEDAAPEEGPSNG